ncbi:MAG: OmpA family protein [Ideonella sp.]|nr:OmpA family protein [Ideonella sp.]
MTRRTSILCGALAAIGMITASVAHAEGIMPTSGYLLPQLSVFDADNDFGVAGKGPALGLRYGMPLSDDIDLQLGISHARRSANGNKVEQTLFSADALYMFSRSDIRPFVSLGLGAERDRRSLALGTTSATSPYLSAGVGVQWMFADNFGLQADYRRVEGFLRDKAAWGFKRASNNYFNIGLLWTFGGEPAPAPRPMAAAAPPAPVYLPPPTPVAPPPPPPPPAAPPAPQRMTLSANSLFDLNSARILPPVAELDDLATALQANPQITSVVITGHTDQLGTPEINRRLSQQRADAVKAYLVGKGVAASRMTARGVGSSQVVTDCRLPTRAEMIKCGTQNRRVEIEPITISRR